MNEITYRLVTEAWWRFNHYNETLRRLYKKKDLKYIKRFIIDARDYMAEHNCKNYVMDDYGFVYWNGFDRTFDEVTDRINYGDIYEAAMKYEEEKN